MYMQDCFKRESQQQGIRLWGAGGIWAGFDRQRGPLRHQKSFAGIPLIVQLDIVWLATNCGTRCPHAIRWMFNPHCQSMRSTGATEAMIQALSFALHVESCSYPSIFMIIQNSLWCFEQILHRFAMASAASAYYSLNSL